MSDRGTHLYVSKQELLAGKSAPAVPVKSHVENKLRLPPKLHKINKDSTDKKAGPSTKNVGWEAEGAELSLQGGSPWKRYREILALLDLGDKVIVACERNTYSKCVNIRRYPRDDKEEERLSWFRNVRHANIVSVLQLFAVKSMLYVILEPMKLPIDHLIRCFWQPSADEVGTIMGQLILDGLAYLESKDICHGALDCRSVLVSAWGDVKIANQDYCVRATREGKKSHLRQVGIIVMKLMQGYVLESGKVGIDNVGQWRDSDILDFVSAVTSADESRQLREHKFISEIWDRESRWPKEILHDLILTAEVTVHRYYQYKPKEERERVKPGGT